ncbi:hypothetical protein FIV34_14700 [Luteibacter pinisoli]|uniref:Ubiquitin-like domain-containing protein n=1 Tax=Luteibacter pinisoli TaxID=2589080 RepID=A0A4Y5Z8D2_9GAMM|nr:hypothetical protein [Luteibacter pinisoli]QDE40368.1 hypothetical protein FIV34_14700 [Luteibacter pinisoli]
MKIDVNMTVNGLSNVISLDVDGADTMQLIKARISQMDPRFDVARMMLTDAIGGDEYDDTISVTSAGIKEGEVVNMELRRY